MGFCDFFFFKMLGGQVICTTLSINYQNWLAAVYIRRIRHSVATIDTKSKMKKKII